MVRRLRGVANRISTGLTVWWLGIGWRQVPRTVGSFEVGIAPTSGSPRTVLGVPRTFLGVPSPGEWVAPDGLRPGWDWLPEHGALPALKAVPWWVRAWYRTPFIDRRAYEWMWWNGGWSVLTPADPPPQPDLG